jgi:hypothetical protein
MSPSTFHFQPNLLPGEAVGAATGIRGARAIPTSECSRFLIVAAVCDRRFWHTAKILGGHRPPLSTFDLFIALILPRIRRGDGTRRKRVAGVATRKVGGTG